MDPKPPTLEKQPVLTFDQFTERITPNFPRYANFALYFMKGAGEISRKEEKYKRFEAENHC